MSRVLTMILVLLSFVLFSFDAWAKTELSAKDKLKIAQAFGKIPLYFVKNDGQVDSKVKFYEKGIGRSTFFAEDGVYISLIASVQEHAKTAPEASAASHVLTEFIAIKPLNVEGAVEVTAQDPLPSKLHYYRGSDPTKWQSNVLTYSKVSYKGIYDGIELVFYGNQRQLEYDIVVGAGANPSKVNFLIEGAKAVSVNTDGDLEIILNSGSKILQKKPYSYQKIDGSQVEIPSSFKVQAHDSGYILAFEVGQYDKSLPLIIDPVVLSYSTFLGGSSDDIGRSIAVDSSGNIYVAGETVSNNFPTLNAHQSSKAASVDAFVAKFSLTGSLLFSTYLGGNGNDYAYSIAVDNSSNVYVTGRTASTNFPTLNAYQASGAGYEDAFVAKLSPTGSLLYSTYLGGNDTDISYGIAVDSSGNVYVTGKTSSTNLPTLNAYQASSVGNSDAFVAKFSPTGGLVFLTYLGGSFWDMAYSIAVDNSSNVYVTGKTASTNFPTLNAYQASNAGGSDAFVAKLSPTGSLLYSTYLGGNNTDEAYGIAVDSSGNVFVTGSTGSTNFPTLNAYQASNAGQMDAFVAKFSPTGSLVFSTYLGGTLGDNAYGVAVDSSGNVYVTGETSSTNLPTLNAYQASNAGGSDAFVAKLSPTGNLLYSTYLGGNNTDISHGIAVDSSGNIYVAGETMSNNFPTLNAYQTSYAGAGDAFITKLSFSSDATKEKFGVISAVVPYNSQTTYVLSTKAIAGSDYRIDPDGTKSYKVQIVLSRLDSGVITKQVVIDELYAGWTDNNEASRALARGALLVRSSGVKVFFSEKATDVNYGQDGYIYSNDLNLSLTFTKTPLFSSANWGWHPYFDNNGDLWHFSFAGYYMYKNTTAVAYISPSESARYMQEQKLLQIGKAVSLTAEMNWNDLENELLGYLSTMLKFTLTVNKTGSGSGTVLGALGGINCGSTCSANLINGSAVTLTATLDNGSSFVGFAGGGCSGAGPCTVVLNSDVTVTATFESLPQISGIVRDSQGVVIPNATVTITKDTFTTTLQTNASGAFSSFLNDIGTYLVSVSKTGYLNSASSVVLTATAKSANIEFTLAISGDFIPLRQGWNFVSFPKLPTDKSISNVLAGKDILIIWGFDNQNKQWLKFKPNDASSSLSSFDYAKGYWIYANQVDNISLEGWLPPSSTTSTLYPGWNLVGYNFTNALDANTALSSIATKAEILWNWDNASWQFKLINPAITLPSAFAPMSTVDKLYQGKAYWIRMRQEGVWSE